MPTRANAFLAYWTFAAALSTESVPVAKDERAQTDAAGDADLDPSTPAGFAACELPLDSNHPRGPWPRRAGVGVGDGELDWLGKTPVQTKLIYPSRKMAAWGYR